MTKEKTTSIQDAGYTSRTYIESPVHLAVYICCFLVCILYVPDLAFAPGTPRWIVLYLFVSVMPLMAATGLLVSGKSYPLRITLLRAVATCFLLWTVLSLFWAVDRANRIDAGIDTAVFSLLILIASFLAERWERSTVTMISGLAAALVSIIGLLQYYGLGGDYYFQRAIPASTFINKNMATPLLVIVLPLVTLEILFQKSMRRVTVLAVSFTTGVAYLVAAATRSSWLGLLTGFLAVLAVSLYSRDTRRMLYSRGLAGRYLLLAAALVSAALLVGGRGLAGSAPAMERTPSGQFVSLFTGELVTGSGRSRLYKWANALDMIGEKPLHGYGIGSFDAAYPLYHDARVRDAEYSGNFFIGGMHNDPLQYLVELGLVGFLLWCGIFICIFYYLYNLISRGEREQLPAYLGWLGGITGLLADSFFNFPFRYPTHIFFFSVIAGMVHAQYLRCPGASPRTVVDPAGTRLLSAALVPVFAAMTCAAIYLSYNKYYSDVHYYYGIQFAKKGGLERSLQHLARSVEYWPYRNRVLFDASEVAYLYYAGQGKKKGYAYARDCNNRALESLPYHYRLIFQKFMLDTDSGDMATIRALREWEPVLVKVAPPENNAEVHESLGRMYYALNEPGRALAYYEKLLALNPEREDIAIIVESLRRQVHSSGG